MSSASIPAFFSEPRKQKLAHAFGSRKASRRPPARVVRRRLNRQSGEALEKLGHAIEYLIDSRILSADSQSSAAMSEAVEILSRASRTIFAESPEIVPLRRKLALWFSLGSRKSPSKPTA